MDLNITNLLIAQILERVTEANAKADQLDYTTTLKVNAKSVTITFDRLSRTDRRVFNADLDDLFTLDLLKRKIGSEWTLIFFKVAKL